MMASMPKRRQLRLRAGRAPLEAFLTGYRYTVQLRVIRSFGDTRTEALFYDEFVRQFQGIARPAKRKLEALNAAGRLEDLAVPPSNRLEKLKGTLGDFYSIRINDQWRVIFKWVKGEPHEVRIVDYH
jgi:toxin HigB-1